jgi:hypothetical protein
MIVFWNVAPYSLAVLDFHQTTRRNIPEDGHIHTRRRENLKSHANLHCMVLAFLPHFFTKYTYFVPKKKMDFVFLLRCSFTELVLIGSKAFLYIFCFDTVI